MNLQYSFIVEINGLHDNTSLFHEFIHSLNRLRQLHVFPRSAKMKMKKMQGLRDHQSQMESEEEQWELEVERGRAVVKRIKETDKPNLFIV